MLLVGNLSLSSVLPLNRIRLSINRRDNKHTGGLVAGIFHTVPNFEGL